MSVSVGDGGTSRNTIVAAMRERDYRWLRRRQGKDDSVHDVVRHPMPADKPRPDAQWDEAAGRWEVWSDAEEGWVSLEDGSVQEPGTRSVTPHEDGVTRPPPVDLR